MSDRQRDVFVLGFSDDVRALRRDAALAAVQVAELACPDARLLVSARDDSHAAQLRAAGASEVFVTPRFP